MSAFVSRNRDRRPPENAGLRDITEFITRPGDDTRCDGVKIEPTVTADFGASRRGIVPAIATETIWDEKHTTCDTLGELRVRRIKGGVTSHVACPHSLYQFLC